MAFMLGLPSVWSQYLLWLMLTLIPIAAFAPVIPAFRRRFSKSASDQATSDLPPIRLSLFKRCICILLSYVMLLSPVVVESLAAGTNDYSLLDISSWGSDNTTITYGYDANGSLTSKVTTLTSDPSTQKEIVDYTYDLQGRLASVTTAGPLQDIDIDSFDDDRYVEVVTYGYNTSGIRVWSDKIEYKYIDYGQGTEVQTKLSSSDTDYLIDASNHTGYAQVLEEVTVDFDDLDAETFRTRIQYTLGDDVISQTTATSADGGANWSAAVDDYLLYDGHGSTRQLVDSSGDLVGGQEYSYDAYGVMLGDSANSESSALTNYLYAGEQYDASASMYYNRARYYNQSNGTFNRVDPYSGNTSDPQSLHKYAYVHNNPVNAIDPTGEFMMMSFAVSGGILGPGLDVAKAKHDTLILAKVTVWLLILMAVYASVKRIPIARTYPSIT